MHIYEIGYHLNMNGFKFLKLVWKIIFLYDRYIPCILLSTQLSNLNIKITHINISQVIFVTEGQ